MAFDPRSLERLRQLGRTLPEPLPIPEAQPAPSGASQPSQRLHRLETETNPQALFRELMRASPDGTVPPHLMARLRELEGSGPTSSGAAATRRAATPPDPGSAGIELGRDDPPALPPPAAPTGKRRPGRAADARSRRGRGSEEEALYAAFQHLLREDENA